MTPGDARILMAVFAITAVACAFYWTVRAIARRAARSEVLSYLRAGMLPQRDKQGRFKRRA